jgi:hypothetical protein
MQKKEHTSGHKLLTNLFCTFSLKLYDTGTKIGDCFFWRMESFEHTPCIDKTKKQIKKGEKT